MTVQVGESRVGQGELASCRPGRIIRLGFSFSLKADLTSRRIDGVDTVKRCEEIDVPAGSRKRVSPVVAGYSTQTFNWVRPCPY